STSGGSVGTEDGWIVAGQNATATATPDLYYEFTGWSGDTQGDTNTNTMIVTMNSAKSLTANFWTDLATNNVPKDWLTFYGLTNATPDEEALDDLDEDLMPAWQEFLAGTDPNDPASLFQIIDSGHENGSNYVVWLGGTNGSALPFTVLGCTNLLSGWSILDGTVERSPSGTNTWRRSSTNQQMFYRIKVNTEN
ncbi:MAG: hypothetical protein KAH23_01375, partial [Kiritimatiellae bacterium]|nr:hypothetical protein [Kiritimatiellia bacterium]